jgi:hypothetical protein
VWDRIDPVRPDRALPRVTSLPRVRRRDQRDRDEPDAREERGRSREGEDAPPDAGAGHVDVRA